MTAQLAIWVVEFGVPAVLVLMTLESCGLPLPSEVIMPAGGLLVAAGHAPLVMVILAGALGNVLGSLAAYWLAAWFGTGILLGAGRWAGIRPRHLAIANGWFLRHGMAAVLAGRVLPVVRGYISFPAGLARVDLPRFCILTFAGALPWCAALTWLGYTVGTHSAGIIHTLDIWVAAAAAAVLATVALWLVLRARSR